MNAQDIANLAKSLGGSQDFGSVSTPSAAATANQTSQSGQPVPGAINPAPTAPGFSDSVKADFQNRATKVGEGFIRAANNEQGIPSTLLQTVGQSAGLIGDVFVEGLNTLTGGLLKQGLQAAGNVPAVKTVMQSLNDWSQKHPEASANLESIINLAALYPGTQGVEAGAEAAGKVGAEAATKGLDLVGDTADVAGNLAKATGKRIYEKVLPTSTQEAGAMQAYKANAPLLSRLKSAVTGEPAEVAGQVVPRPVTVGETAADKGILGSETMMGIQANRTAKDLWKNTIEPAVASIQQKISTNDLFQAVEKKIADLADPSAQASWNTALDAVKEDFSKVKDFTYTQAQKLKSSLDDVVPEKMFRGQPVTGAYNNIRFEMANYIRQKTYEALQDMNIRKDYLDYGNLVNLKKLGISAMTGSKLKGGFGSFMSGLKEIGVVPVGTLAGQTLYRAGDMLFQGAKGIKTLADYFSRFGFWKKP